VIDVGALLDVVVVATLLWVAWRATSEPALFTAAAFFIVFGLVMALAWVRLAAPDIAIAEAAIGAGLTGALVLDAVAHVGGAPGVDAPERDRADTDRPGDAGG